MKVKLLKESYLNSEQIYDDFLNNKIIDDFDHYSGQEYELNNIEPFPIYLNYKDDEIRRTKYFKAFEVIKNCYLSIEKDITMNQSFWHSLFLTNFRDYVLINYPTVNQNKNNFKNILLKKFDWENYIYKCLLAVEYISDQVQENDRMNFYDQIINNLDLFNYLIKYSVFRNDKFITGVLKVVKKLDASNILKAQIKDRLDLGSDERYGRRVIFEFNKDYPVVLSPMMSDEFLEKQFIKHLRKYLTNY